MKEILFNEKARAKMKEGVDAVCNAVKVTIGPLGRNVALDKSFGGPTITNDGVSIAREITLKDKYANMGAEIIKEVASRTNDLAGDGTSTSVILTQSMIDEGMKSIKKGDNALSIKKGMDLAQKDAQVVLSELKRELKDATEIERVATVSAESEEIGKIISDTLQKIGKDGVVTVDESQYFRIESEFVKGLKIDNGFISPYMMTNPHRLEAEYRDVPILVTDKNISNVKEILPLLENIIKTGKKDIVIIAENIEGEALTTFIVNKLRGTFNVLAIKAPGFGDKKKEILEDICSTTGGTLVSSDKGDKFEDIGLDSLGKADKVVSTRDDTIIVGNETDRVEERIKTLKDQLDSIESKFDKENIKERIAKLKGGVAVIKVGAATEGELKYLKLKIEDSVNATKAAIEEGIVTGGGSSLVHISEKLKEKIKKREFKNNSEKKGYSIVIDSLISPLRNIVDNAYGKGKGSNVISNLVKQNSTLSGYDVLKGELVEDMFKQGIIDPAKVVRTGLQNSVSASGIFITTDAAIVDINEDKEKPETPPMMGI